MLNLFQGRGLRVLFAALALIIAVLISYYLFTDMTAEVWDFNIARRLKIVAAIILVAAAVGISSVVFQTITTNYILTPSIMGLDNLYVFMQTLVIYFWGSTQLVMMTDVTQFLVSLFFMVLASGCIFMLMFKGVGQSVFYVVLIGIVFGIAFDGLSSFMQVLIDPNEFAVLEGKMFASFNHINTPLLGLAWGLFILVGIWVLKDVRKYDVLSLGRSNAITLGINYQYMVYKSLIAVSIMSSISTVLVGPVTFLGILIVSLARVLLPTYRHSILISITSLVGVAVLMLGMIVTERFLNFIVPLSVILNLTGGAAFIFLILKTKRI